MDNQQLKDPQNPSGPVTVRNLKVHVDRDLCIGAATCMAVAQNAFALDSDAKAVVLRSADKETLETLIDAAKSCPTAAITILDAKGNKIYPK